MISSVTTRHISLIHYSTHHCCDVTIGAMASQITSFTIVYSTVHSGADQRKHESSASLAFVRGIYRSLVNSPHKLPVTRKMIPFNDVIMSSDNKAIAVTIFPPPWCPCSALTSKPLPMESRSSSRPILCQSSSKENGTSWSGTQTEHDDVIKWKHFPRYWPFMRGIHRSRVNSSHKGQWLWALMFSLICAWINGWVNNGDAGDLRRNRTHYDVTVMNSDWSWCQLCLHRRSVTAKLPFVPYVFVNAVHRVVQFIWAWHLARTGQFRRNWAWKRSS